MIEENGKDLAMKRIFALMLCFALTLCGCAAPNEGETFTDGMGTEVPVPGELHTVAVLFSSYAEAWVMAGGTVSVTVGESVERGFAEEGVILVDEGSGHSVIDTEALIAAKPDLVIGTADYPCQTEAIELCRGAGIPAALFRQESVEDYLGMFRVFCDLMGNDAAWEAYGEAVRLETEEILREAENGAPQRILLVRAGSSARSTKAKGSEDLTCGGMLRDLGAVNIADEAPVLLDGLSLEHILMEDPDWLFITTMGDETAAREYMGSLLREPGWRELSCVRDGRVVYLEKSLYHFKPNHRWAEAYRGLWEILGEG